MKLILCIIFISTTLFAQFTPKDYDLVKNTFYRNFDKSIITKYLKSDDKDSVNAALLSISHSNETTWIDKVIKLDFNN